MCAPDNRPRAERIAHVPQEQPHVLLRRNSEIFLRRVQQHLRNDRQTHNRFRSVLRAFRLHRISERNMIRGVIRALRFYVELVLLFRIILPPGNVISLDIAGNIQLQEIDGTILTFSTRRRSRSVDFAQNGGQRLEE